ncbi:hypothetical protein [Phormidium sp. FACHB-592]|uniref:hypothetical protein n=1 Tax=Phormidium sp. FACHB-592 TaxID=2692850 RepID=UPI001A7E369D|nr:hypothetical protein [Phormidium sp. FACHB-592]
MCIERQKAVVADLKQLRRSMRQNFDSSLETADCLTIQMQQRRARRLAHAEQLHKPARLSGSRGISDQSVCSSFVAAPQTRSLMH